ATPTVTDGERCGSGRVNLSATGNSGDETYWFTSSSGGTGFASGSNILSPHISQTTDYYVENSSLVSKSISSYQGHFRYNGSPTGGSFFDIKAFNEILVDSISQLCAYSADNVVVTIYYKQGSYLGAETNASAWTILTQQTITTPGWGKYFT